MRLEIVNTGVAPTTGVYATPTPRLEPPAKELVAVLPSAAVLPTTSPRGMPVVMARDLCSVLERPSSHPSPERPPSQQFRRMPTSGRRPSTQQMPGPRTAQPQQLRPAVNGELPGWAPAVPEIPKLPLAAVQVPVSPRPATSAGMPASIRSSCAQTKSFFAALHEIPRRPTRSSSLPRESSGLQLFPGVPVALSSPRPASVSARVRPGGLQQHNQQQQHHHHQRAKSPPRALTARGAIHSDDTGADVLNQDIRWILFPRPTDKAVEGELRQAEAAPGLEPHDELLHALRRAPLLAGMSDAGLAALLRAGRVRHYPRYATLGREGTRCREFVVLLHGTVGVLSSREPSQAAATEGRGASFWPGALVTDVVRECSVGALTGCRVLALTRDDVAASAAVGEALASTPAWYQLQRAVALDALRALPFFGSRVEGARLEALSQLMSFVHFAPGEVIFEEGDFGATFYVLLQGRVVIRSTRPYAPHQLSAAAAAARPGEAPDESPDAAAQQERVLATYTEGVETPWFGEIAVWLTKPRCGTATAEVATRCLALGREHFETLLHLVPEFRPHLTRQAKYWKEISQRSSLNGAAQMEAQMQQTRTKAAIRWRSGGALGSSPVGGSKSRGLGPGRAKTADAWEKLVMGALIRHEKGVATPHHFVPSLSFLISDYNHR